MGLQASSLEARSSHALKWPAVPCELEVVDGLSIYSGANILSNGLAQGCCQVASCSDHVGFGSRNP